MNLKKIIFIAKLSNIIYNIYVYICQIELPTYKICKVEIPEITAIFTKFQINIFALIVIVRKLTVYFVSNV